MSGRQTHRAGALLLSGVMAIVGLALIVEALAASGPVSYRLLVGILFLLAGAGRLYVEIRRGRGT